MARRASRDPSAGSTELNLVPIMNLVVCLIPIVLLGTALVKVGVIETTPPRIVPTVNPDPIHTEALNLELQVGPDGFALEARGIDLHALTGTTGEPGQPARIARVGELLDYAALYRALVAIKNERPDETQMNVTAAAGTPWREIVSTLDVARVRLEGNDIADATALAAATPRTGPAADVLLWPDVVFLAAR